jgi:tetrahydromethanopterin S-methyltransferase subunit C
MPIACDANGFQIAHSDYVKPELSMALYGLFISAIIGLVIGVLLLIKKNIPVVIDWLVVLVCMCCGLIPFFMNVRQYQFQSGMYMILTGYALIFIAQIVSLIRKEA